MNEPGFVSDVRVCVSVPWGSARVAVLLTPWLPLVPAVFFCVFENDLLDTSFITPSLRMRALWLSLRSQLPALLEDICTCKATPIEEPPPAVPTSEGEGDAAAALLGLAREEV